MKNLKKKKGFTLIELMIVLAIIGILAVVLIPKAGIFKKQAKTQGVITNMNVVKAFLEIKTEDKFLDAAKLQDAMASNFTGSETLVNPFTKSETIPENVSTAVAADTTSTGPVYISSNATAPVTSDKLKGVVIILVTDKTASTPGKYEVYGVDADGVLVKSTADVISQ